MSRPALASVDAEPVSTAVEITVVDEQTDIEIDAVRWLTLASKVLAAEGVGAGLPNGIEMSVVFVDEATIAELNERFMGKSGPTDVLSFPIDEEAAEPRRGGPHDFDEDGVPIGEEILLDARIEDDRFRDYDGADLDDAPLLLGDILICPSYASANASEHVGECHDGSVDDELALLVVHGILHLLGMDHLVDSDAEEMEARELEHLRRYNRPSMETSSQ